MICLEASKEAITRCKRLASSDQCEKTASRVNDIYKLVSHKLGQDYLTPALELASTFSKDYEHDHPPNSNFLRIVQTIVGITHCVHSHFVQVCAHDHQQNNLFYLHNLTLFYYTSFSFES
jgi:hypothetical protein